MATTEELVSELSQVGDAAAFLKTHREDLHRQTLDEYLRSLMEARKLKVSDLAVSANFGDYLYKVCGGKRHPSRDALLAIVVGLRLAREDAAHVMRLAGYHEPDVRDARDAVILHGIEHGVGLDEVNTTLYELGMDVLFDKTESVKHKA
ncbi:MAG: helix-turn-helix domain-containing protein [Schwartzia sp.]|nr:helix-turn-helix domain-containing protein [Schwartzia sp. (in: firmicutes)]